MVCDDDKVLNPKTGRCVKVGGGVFKDLIKDPSVKFSNVDMDKIKNAGYKIASPVKLADFKSGLLEVAPSKPIEAKVDHFLRKRTGLKQLPYLDEGHKEYCTKGKSDNLKIPLTTSQISYKIPYSVSPAHKLNNFQQYLGSKKIPFAKSFNIPITLSYNNYNKVAALELFKDQSYEIDYVWFSSVNDYVQNLSTYDIFTVLGYSYHSYDYINKYLIGTMTSKSLQNLLAGTSNFDQYYFPFYMQAYTLLSGLNLNFLLDVTIQGTKKDISKWIKDCLTRGLANAYPTFTKIMQYLPFEFWKSVMGMYKDDLKRIIEHAPAVRKEMVVYRGVTDDYFLKGAKNLYYKNTAFVSTSLNPIHSYKYLRNKQCCFKRLTLLPGANVLFISGLSFYPQELEIVINVDSTLYIRDFKTSKIYADGTTHSTELCDTKMTKLVDIADMVVL